MSQLPNRLSQHWDRIQGTLFPQLEEELDPLTEKQQQLVTTLELEKKARTTQEDEFVVKPKKKSRPKKGEEKSVPEPTRIEKQKTMTPEEMLNDLPGACDKGAKKDNKGNVMYWNGYKLHLDTIDGGIPVSAIVTSASVHDSQVAIPLATVTAQKIVHLYDLMDAAYDVPAIIEHSKNLRFCSANNPSC